MLTALIAHDDSVGVLDELSTIRALLEAEMAREIVGVRTHVELDVLRSALDEMRSAFDEMCASVHETAVFSAADVQFHEIVMAISGNGLAESIAHVLFARACDSARYRGNVPLSFHEQTRREHEQVFAAIEAGTIDAAGLAMNSHIIDPWRRRRPADDQGKNLAADRLRAITGRPTCGSDSPRFIATLGGASAARLTSARDT